MSIEESLDVAFNQVRQDRVVFRIDMMCLISEFTHLLGESLSNHLDAQSRQIRALEAEVAALKQQQGIKP